ncbi:hypothetical protein L7F22_014584 [Adiantum nelumboides]|nr:hypothetical protein [Adiantum nelumboides]
METVPDQPPGPPPVSAARSTHPGYLGIEDREIESGWSDLDGISHGPILSAHKQLVAKKLEAAADGRKKRTERKKEKQALREKGHVVPTPFSAAKDKELIKLATRGVVKLFNAVSKAQSVQEDAKVTKTTDAKDVAKRSKSTFLAMLQDGNESSFKGQKQPVHDKMEMVAECQPGWSALQDTFMLGKSRLKDWDKKQDDEAGVEGTGNSSNDSDSDSE